MDTTPADEPPGEPDAPEPAFDPSGLNQSFYSADPADYYRRRLNVFLLAAGKPDELGDLLAAGRCQARPVQSA